MQGMCAFILYFIRQNSLAVVVAYNVN